MRVHEQVTGQITRACPVCGPVAFRVEDQWLSRGPFGRVPVSHGRARRLVCTSCEHRVHIPAPRSRSLEGLSGF